tara:strand:+ start:2302 stop:2586 length:285 start_codon:yes stop_codon:yes gene_type:complete
MKVILLYILSFANFWWLPLAGIFLASLVIEQVVLRSETASDNAKIGAMRFRRFAFQQNMFINIVWLICYTILNIMFTQQAPWDPLSGDGIQWRN